jgi:putative oxidoreductase
MKTVNLIIRILLGLLLLVTGLNKFLQFMPMPEMTEQAQQTMMAFVQTGYIMNIVAIVEIVVGLLLIINKYTALSLVILFPIMLNAFLFHLFLDVAGIGGSVMAITFNIYLMIAYRDRYYEVLKA